MLLEPRVVLGTLDGEVEGDLQAVVGGCSYQATKIFASAQLWMDRLVSALLATNGIRAARIVRTGGQELFGPLRKLRPIGWIGGKYSTSKPMS